MVEYLNSKGADANAQDVHGYTPASYVCGMARGQYGALFINGFDRQNIITLLSADGTS